MNLYISPSNSSNVLKLWYIQCNNELLVIKIITIMLLYEDFNLHSCSQYNVVKMADGLYFNGGEIVQIVPHTGGDFDINSSQWIIFPFKI